ncbi:MAG: hypothetical protein Q4D29_09405 [Lachnospiraceae bacterium]|nr:hypothetical protein [Lachnospiraceae bacterium]
MNRTPKFSTSKFIFSILFNAAVLAVALIVFKPYFEEIDDTQIAMLVEGAFTQKEWHVIYPNFILGGVYVFLQNAFPMVRWHIILQYVFIYISYVFSVYVISKHKRGVSTSIVAVLATFYELYVSIQYTKTAAFVCVAAFIMFFEYVRNKTSLSSANDTVLSFDNKANAKENVVFLITSSVLLVYGAMLRPESFFIAAVPAAAVGLLELLRTKNILKYIATFGPAFIMVILLATLNSYVYSIDAEWSDFMKYNQARMQLNDYRYDILDYNRYANELQVLGVSENDALAILTYQYGDDSVLSYERFKEIRDAFPARSFGYETFANLYENIINEIPRSFAMFAGFGGLIIILIASIVTDRSKSSPGFIRDARRKLYCMIMCGFCFSAAVIYFQYSGRFSHRLVGAICIPSVFLVCYMMDSLFIKDNDSKIVFGGNKNDITVAAGIALSVLLIGLNGILYISNMKDYENYRSETDPILRELDEISNDKDSLYIADTFTFQDVFRYEVFIPFSDGQLSNFVTCGSWYLNSPVTKAITRHYGYENPFKALISGEENVYLLDNTGVACKTLFLTEHYDKIYEAKKAENRGGIDVYHMVSNDDN